MYPEDIVVNMLCLNFMKSIDIFITGSEIKLTTTTLNYFLGHSWSQKTQYITQVAKYWFSKNAHAHSHTHAHTHKTF